MLTPTYLCVHLVCSSNCSSLLIKSPKAKLCLILNARCDMSYENPVAQVYVQIEQNRVQSQSYYNLIIIKTPQNIRKICF